ncbi:MAG: hypothetical protein AMXMBFR84_46730 [Candidatus Hydrogenedentota bacterium]
MTKHRDAKRERIVEAVRLGYEGEDAVAFVRQSGFVMSGAGIARHLKSMGGWTRLRELIDQGKTNVEILEICCPDVDVSQLPSEPPSQGILFDEAAPRTGASGDDPEGPVYETRKMAIKVPADLYEAIRLAAKAERKTHNDIIVDILTTALSQVPVMEIRERSEEGI